MTATAQETSRLRFKDFVGKLAEVLDSRTHSGGWYGPEGYAYRMLLGLIDVLYWTIVDRTAVTLERVLPQIFTGGPDGDSDRLYELRVTRAYTDSRGKSRGDWFRVFLTSEDCEVLPGLEGNWKSLKIVPAYAKTAEAVLRYIVEWQPGETAYNSKKRMRMVKDCVALPLIDEVQQEMDAK